MTDFVYHHHAIYHCVLVYYLSPRLLCSVDRLFQLRESVPELMAQSLCGYIKNKESSCNT